jgi:hypothetical protein
MDKPQGFGSNPISVKNVVTGAPHRVYVAKNEKDIASGFSN